MSCGPGITNVPHFGCCGGEPGGRLVMGMMLYWSNLAGNRDGERRYFEQAELESMFQRMQDFIGSLDYGGTACSFETVSGTRTLGANPATIPEWTWSPDRSLPQSVTNAPDFSRHCQASHGDRGDQFLSVFRLKFWPLENTDYCHRIEFQNESGTILEYGELKRTRPIVFFPALVSVPLRTPGFRLLTNIRREFANESPPPGCCG